MDDQRTELTGSGDPIALWVVPVGDFGGVARHVLDVCSRGIPGWRIVVLAPAGPLVDACTDAGVAVIPGSLGPDHGLARSVRCLRNTSEFLRPGVIHSHLAHADITAAVAFPRRRGPLLISTEHGISGERSLYQRPGVHSRIMELAHRVRLRSFDGVIAVSQSTADQMRRRWRPPHRLPIVVMPNGIDPERYPESAGTPVNTGPPALRISTISRLSHEKRLEVTLSSFAELLRREPSARLTIAGEGPDREDLLRRCTQLGLDGAVAFPGFMNAQELLRRTDVLVQLSAWENCSYTILDAVNAGVGVVATPVGGNPELLPERCLIGSEDPRAIAARIHDQATDLRSRPSLPADWPSIRDMNAGISDLYARLAR